MAIKDTDHLLKRIQGSWAFSEVQHVLNWRIYLTLVEPVVGIGRGEQAALARAILTPAGTDGGVRVDYDRANQLADALLNLSRCDLDRSALRDALTLSTDGLAYMGRVRELERIERLLCSRVVRIRNAITHGNAFTLAAALSVDNYLLYLTELLLDEAIKAAVTGQTLASLLDTRKKDRQTFGDRLNGGARLADVIKQTG
jgi:hypothetical protein